MTPSEKLKQYHPGLVSRNTDINDELTGFQNMTAYALQQFESAVEAAKRVDPDKTPEANQRDQRAALAKASNELQTAVDKASQPYKATVGALRQALELSLRPSVPKTEISELTSLLKAQEIRRVLMDLPVEDVSHILRSTVAAGDPSVLHALEGSLVPLVAEQIMDSARNRFLEVAEADKLQQLETAEIMADSVGTTQRFVEKAARGVADKAGLVEMYDSRNQKEQTDFINLSTVEKTAYIAENGLDAFKNLFI